MMRSVTSPSSPPGSRWPVALAFTLLYLAWGTTYYAIRVGVHEEQMPPAIFSGSRVCVAGLLVLVYLWLRGQRIRLRGDEWVSAIVGALLLFVLGNGLVAVALDDLPSGVIAVIVATTPLWIALLEALLPHGERLSSAGWLGVLLGLAGVLLISGQLNVQANYQGIALGLASSFCWAAGSLVLRYRGRPASHLASAAYQMALGGAGLCLVGLAFGEGPQAPWPISGRAVAALVWLLIVGSLIGFVAFNWLLGQVSAARVGTYAYVNPLVALLVAWLLGDGALTIQVLGAMLIILIGVALVRRAGATRKRAAAREAVRFTEENQTPRAGSANPLAKTKQTRG